MTQRLDLIYMLYQRSRSQVHEGPWHEYLKIWFETNPLIIRIYDYLVVDSSLNI